MSHYVSTLSERHEDVLSEDKIVEVIDKITESSDEITDSGSDDQLTNSNIDADEEEDNNQCTNKEKKPSDNNTRKEEGDVDEERTDNNCTNNEEKNVNAEKIVNENEKDEKISDDNDKDSADDNDIHKAVLTVPPTESYLPSWVLKMRNKINESRIAHAKTESRIDSLHLSISNLDLNLQTLRCSTRTIKSIDLEQVTSIAAYSFFLHQLPVDLIGDLFC